MGDVESHKNVPLTDGEAVASIVDGAKTGYSSILHQRVNESPAKVIGSKGNYLITDTGLEIFDASCGAAVACLGHTNPRVKEAIIEQLHSVEYCYLPFFTTEPAEKLARHLVDYTQGQMSKVFIVSSGSEAVEAALKLARQYFTELPDPQLQRTRFISRKQSYHGNTMGALSVGYHAARRGIYEPILTHNVSHVSPCNPYRGLNEGESNDQYVARLVRELEDEFQRVGPETVCAFIAETMSGTSLGCSTALPGYFQGMKEVCEKHGALFILDEVMCGMGRTGTLHAWEQEGIVPDLQAVAKGLGAGYIPIGALLINKKIVDTLSTGSGVFIHSQTYQGHPVACAASFEVQQIVKEEDLLANVKTLGVVLEKKLKERLGHHKHVGDIRGRGFFWALEFVEDKVTKKPFPPQRKIAALVHAAGMQNGISFIPANGNIDGVNGDVLLIAPAYNITAKDIELIVSKMEEIVKDVLG